MLGPSFLRSGCRIVMHATTLRLITLRNIAYHPGVRKLFLILLILLLPLRGWTADAMVQSGPEHAPRHSLTMNSAMAPDCAMAMTAAPQGDATASETHASDGPAHQGCHACQLCMPLAALPCCAWQGPARARQAARPLPAVAFASATLEPGNKPPIL